PRHVEQRREGVGRELVAGDAVVVLDAEDEHAALGVGEARDLLGHLVAHLAAVTRALLALLALEHRLSVEVLAFVATEEGREIEGGGGHAASPARVCPASAGAARWACCFMSITRHTPRASPPPGAV